MSKKLSKPFDYYWKMYMDGKCPFCKADLIATSENRDIVFCQEYGGYLTTQACESYRDPADGRCRDCRPEDKESGKFEFIEDQAFLCENCNHGVVFSDSPTMIKDRFLHDEEGQECTHCAWHEKQIKKQAEKEKYKPADISEYL